MLLCAQLFPFSQLGFEVCFGPKLCPPVAFSYWLHCCSPLVTGWSVQSSYFMWLAVLSVLDLCFIITETKKVFSSHFHSFYVPQEAKYNLCGNFCSCCMAP